MTVHIICAVFNGARFLPEFLQSLDAQTHADWRLWVRDDGSADTTPHIIRDAASRDPRVCLVHTGGPQLGAAGAFGWLLDQLPADAEYVMCADQDDVWLPLKIEATLAAMRDAEREGRTPARGAVLVHTDLSVVDDALRLVHPSFWTFAGIEPEPVSLRRFAVRNVVTGATVMINRPLRELIGSPPPEAIFHDWWFSLVAAALGRVVSIRRATVLYRQHTANTVGARDSRIRLRELPRAIVAGLNTASNFRQGVEKTAAQASAFLDRYGHRMTADDRRFLREYSDIPRHSFLRRKFALLRLRALPEHGLLRTLGILVRG